jgi:hypothetical protein
LRYPNTLLDRNKFWLLFTIAVVGFIPTIWFYYVGKEAGFLLTAIELFLRYTDWLDKTRYGVQLSQNPLFIWRIIPFPNCWAGRTCWMSSG